MLPLYTATSPQPTPPSSLLLSPLLSPNLRNQALVALLLLNSAINVLCLFSSTIYGDMQQPGVPVTTVGEIVENVIPRIVEEIPFSSPPSSPPPSSPPPLFNFPLYFFPLYIILFVAVRRVVAAALNIWTPPPAPRRVRQQIPQEWLYQQLTLTALLRTHIANNTLTPATASLFQTLLRSGEINADDYSILQEGLSALSPPVHPHTHPLPPATLAALPLTLHPPTSPPTPCPICLDDMKPNEQVMTLPCTHQFHGKCATTWLNTADFCPVCRGVIGGGVT